MMPGPSPFHGNVLRWRRRHIAYETCQLEALQADPQGGPSQLVMCHAPTEKGARHCPDCAKRLLTKYDNDVPVAAPRRLYPLEHNGIPSRRAAQR